MPADALDHTHAPDAASWLEDANAPGADFPIQNLPLGVGTRGTDDEPRILVAIGAHALDLPAALDAGALVLEEGVAAACRAGTLNVLMGQGRAAARSVRHAVFDALAVDALPERRAGAERALVPLAGLQLGVPAAVGDYTDFYASVHHATNVGSMFRPDNPLLPNYKWVPIGYHGRASSLVPSGTAVRRPAGQIRDDASAPPAFGPSRRLDYELELGFWIGAGNALGEPIPVAEAGDRIFGVSLVNDWSARDLQTWEYQPLGPFLAKSFATTVSPWVVTLDALAPFRAPAFARPAGDPAPLPYLSDGADRRSGGLDITLEVWLSSARMREQGIAPVRLTRGNFAGMYWTPAQLVAHHASNGCNLRPGDLLASGTVSGPTKDSRGCLLELTWRGTEPIELPTGETRRFLEDGDEVVMRGHCERAGARRIGLGEARGQVVG